MSNKRTFTNEEILDIIDLYVNKGWFVDTIRKKYSCRVNAIKRVLTENDIPIRRKSVLINKFLKEDYFENINTEAKAYLLGFITADGSVLYRNRKSATGVLSLSVKSSDIEIINLLKTELNCESKIGYNKRKDKECVSISISSTKLVKSLEKYGVVPNKTYKLNKIYTNFEDNELLIHYLRGLIDGDGCISFNKEKNKSFIYFCSYSKEFVESFRVTVNNLINIKCKNSTFCVGATYRASWSLQSARAVCELLYTNCSFYLTRKYNRAKVILGV